MSEYTEEDFKNARFADHEDWGTAARTNDTRYPLWFVAKTGEPWFMEDHEMAESGWRPVVEARILEHTLRDLRHDLALARKERDRLAQNLRRLYGHPKGGSAITLDGLRAAWENAEVPTEANPVCKGDEVIRAIDLRARGAFEVSIAESWLTGVWSGREGSGLRVRVLRRAPQPEPWQALAGVLRTTGCDGQAMDPEILASVLHERGVRVVGGDET